MIEIAIIDDDKILLEQFSLKLSIKSDINVVISADSVDYFKELYISKPKIDILFLDINLIGNTGIFYLDELRLLLPETDIVIYTVDENYQSLITAISKGVTGYLLKSVTIDELYSFIQTIKNGGSAISAKMASKIFKTLSSEDNLLSVLNEKEAKILELLSEGWSYKLIADKMDFSTDGVRFYIKRIYKALNVNSKGEAIRIFYKGQ